MAADAKLGGDHFFARLSTSTDRWTLTRVAGLFALGVIAGPTLVLADSARFSDAADAFAGSSRFTLWLAVVAVYLGFTFLVIVPIGRRALGTAKVVLARGEDDWARRIAYLIGPAAVTLVLGIAIFPVLDGLTPVKTVAASPLPLHRLKLSTVQLVGAIPSAIGIAGGWLVLGRITERVETASGTLQDRIERWMELRDELTIYLAIAATGLVFGTASVSTFQSALGKFDTASLEVDPTHEAFSLGQEASLVFGLVATALLAISFLPAVLALAERSCDLRQEVAESDRSETTADAGAEVDPGTTGAPAAVPGPTLTERVGALWGSLLDGIRMVVPIVSPLLSAVVAALIGA